jgi:DNA polymerase-3 subunit delta'
MPFKLVVGHRRLVSLLARSVDRGSLPPSLIFAGPAGIGKRLTATATAQLVNCTSRVGQSPDIDACGECAACTRIARGVHSDVLIVEPGDNGSIKIEQVREIVDRAAYRPFEGRCRVVIFDAAAALVPAAQTALLKTLEEPPSASIFILVTAQPDLLLPTVRSRCPCLRFGPLATDDIVATLMAGGRTELQARAVAATADGSMRRALTSKPGDLVEGREIAQQVLVRAAGISDPRRRIEGAKDLLAKTGGGGAGDRDQLAVHLLSMASLLRDAEILATQADAGALANPDLQPTLERLAQTYCGERGQRAFAAVDRALAALDRNAGVKVVADWLVLQL